MLEAAGKLELSAAAASEESQGEPAAPVEPKAEPKAEPAKAPADDDVVARVRAKLEAKKQAAAQVQPAPAPAPAAVPEPPLRERLKGKAALDYLVEQDVDVIELYESLTARANTPAQQRAAEDKIEALAAKVQAMEDGQARAAEQAAYRSAANEFQSFVRDNAARFPLLAAESAAKQLRRAVRASKKLEDAGEAGSAEDICALCEDAIRRSLAKYPGVSLGNGADTAGRAETGKAKAKPIVTLNGSLAGETSTPGATPRLGSRELKAHMVQRLETLMAGVADA
jgi:hypothetical protein